MRNYWIEACEPAGIASIRRRERNPARARRNGHCDLVHAARCVVGSRSEETESRGRIARLRLVNLMSRIGNKAVMIPDKVKVNISNDGAVAVEGPKGKLNWQLPRDISAKIDNGKVTLARAAETRSVKALHGLSRSLVHNMVQGVSEGFSKNLEIEGVGFK